VKELVIILPDYFSIAIAAQARTGAAAAAGLALPRLSALEGLLRRSQHRALPEGGWRAWLTQRWRLPQDSMASIVAAAWGEPREAAQQYWLATPVHLVAGIDSVRLHPQGLLQLTGSEQAQLVSDFARVFHDAPWRLTGRGRRELLLAGPVLAASGVDPATLLGADPSAGLPQGADAAKLRRLNSEIELWLHEHPVNVQRQRRAQLPVTALWLWGSAAAVDASARADAARHDAQAAVTLPVLSGADTYVEALWQLRGGAAQPTASGGASVAAETRGQLLLQRVCEPPGLIETLTTLEQRWLAPAAAALRSRRLHAIHVVTAERSHSLGGWSLARLWRRRCAWWALL
jgi:hypothetical protein